MNPYHGYSDTEYGYQSEQHHGTEHVYGYQGGHQHGQADAGHHGHQERNGAQVHVLHGLLHKQIFVNMLAVIVMFTTFTDSFLVG